MHGIVEKIELQISELPDFTTVCVRKRKLKMAAWRTLLRLSAELHDTGEVQAIDATGLDRHSASRHYANQTDYTFRSVKTTVSRYSHEISTSFRQSLPTKATTGTPFVTAYYTVRDLIE